MKNINKFINMVNEKIKNSEYNLVKIKGVSLSRSDLEMSKMYAEFILKNDFSLMQPRGEVKQLLEKYNIAYKKESG